MENPELHARAIRSLVGRDDPHIIEIGANDGLDTASFLREFPAGRVSCFECDPRAIVKWHKHVPADQSRATLTEAALADAPGVMAFFPSAGREPGRFWQSKTSWDKSGSLLKPDRHSEYVPWLSFDNPVEVPVTTLDLWRNGDDGIIDFAWVDVQGAEALVLKGAIKTIPHIRWWYCECHSLPYYQGQATLAEIIALLPGFVLHSVHQKDNFLFRNTAL